MNIFGRFKHQKNYRLHVVLLMFEMLKNSEFQGMWLFQESQVYIDSGDNLHIPETFHGYLGNFCCCCHFWQFGGGFWPLWGYLGNRDRCAGFLTISAFIMSILILFRWDFGHLYYLSFRYIGHLRLFGEYFWYFWYFQNLKFRYHLENCMGVMEF